MKVLLYDKNHKQLDYIKIEIFNQPLVLEAKIETPLPFQKGDICYLNPLDFGKIAFVVQEEVSPLTYKATSQVQEELKIKIHTSYAPSTKASRILKSELKSLFNGSLDKDYTFPYFAFSGTLNTLLGIIERKSKSKAYLTQEKVTLGAKSQEISLGKFLRGNFGEKQSFSLGDSFSLLPLIYEKKEIEKVHWNFKEQTLTIFQEGGI